MLLAGLALAGSNVLFFNGGQLYNMCKDTNTINQAACEGYILGVQDTIYSGYLSQHFNLCFPNSRYVDVHEAYFLAENLIRAVYEQWNERICYHHVKNVVEGALILQFAYSVKDVEHDVRDGESNYAAN